MTAKIPKTIHYCWFGGGEKSALFEKCIESWKKYCPDYEIVEWNENNFDVSMNPFVKEAYENKKWAFVADYCRLWAIYNFGGVYFDTDVELIKNIDEVLENQVFFCFENKVNINTGLGFGAVKKSKIIKAMMKDYDDADGLDLTPCPVVNTRALKKLDEDTFKKIKLYSAEYFCPLNYDTGKLNLTDKTYAIHWYDGSWLVGRKKFRKMVKRWLIKMIGEERYDKIRYRKSE